MKHSYFESEPCSEKIPRDVSRPGSPQGRDRRRTLLGRMGGALTRLRMAWQEDRIRQAAIEQHMNEVAKRRDQANALRGRRDLF